MFRESRDELPQLCLNGCCNTTVERTRLLREREEQDGSHCIHKPPTSTPTKKARTIPSQGRPTHQYRQWSNPKGPWQEDGRTISTMACLSHRPSAKTLHAGDNVMSSRPTALHGVAGQDHAFNNGHVTTRCGRAAVSSGSVMEEGFIGYAHGQPFRQHKPTIFPLQMKLLGCCTDSDLLHFLRVALFRR